MSCRDVQLNLSLYIYGELDFQQEEAVEQHLSGCALCQAAFTREKAWHSLLNGIERDVPFDVLGECRRNIRAAVLEKPQRPKAMGWRWLDLLGVRPSVWSMRVALASFLVLLGFGAGRWVERNGLAGGGLGFAGNEAALLNGHIRDIQPSDNDRVRIIVDQVQEKQITGGVDDDRVRQLLLAATKDAADPGIRVDSVEILNGHGGMDVRDALLRAVRQDPNDAVRLKALDGLRQFADDSVTQSTVEYVLEHDQSPEVRSQAIEVLAPMSRSIESQQGLARVLQGIASSDQDDQYVRDRCFQILHEMKYSPDVY